MSTGDAGREVCIVGVGHSTLSRASGQSVGAHALAACRSAMIDCGIAAKDVDGISGVYSTDLATVGPGYVSEGLGLGDITYCSTATPPSANTLVNAYHAIASGAIDVCLCYHAKYRWDVTSREATGDPFRRSPPMTFDPNFSQALAGPLPGILGIAAYMQRHMWEFGSKREHFGMIAVNNRTHARSNPRAVFRRPMTIEDYLQAPMIYEPFSMFDMDAPIDGGQAVVLCSLARAKDLKQRPIKIMAAASAMTGQTDMLFQPFDQHLGSGLLMKRLWAKSGLQIQDIDLMNIYDGFTIITMDWLEAVIGERGVGPDLLKDSWDSESQTLRFFGRIPMSTHGGNLSEGRVQGMGHVLEAVEQLRGDSTRQIISDGRFALVTNGFNPFIAGLILGVLE